MITSVTPCPTYANTDEEMNQAQELVAKARQSLRQGQLRRAVELFEEANQRVPTPDYLFAIASIHSRIEGNCVKTIKSWERFLSDCKTCSRRAKGLMQLEVHQKLCQVMINIQSTPSGAEVSFDGQRIGTTPVSFPTLAGTHQLTWTLKDHHPHESEVVLLKGNELAVKHVKLIPVSLQSHASQRAASPPPKSANLAVNREAIRPYKDGQYKWALVATSGIITSLGVISVLLAHSEVNDLNNAGSETEFERLERDASYQLKQGFGYAGVGIGLGLLSYSLLRYEF